MRNAQRAHLLIVDVDGTLLTDGHEVTAATRAAVQQVTEREVQVVLASARSPGALRGILGTLGIDGLVIGYTGAITCRLSPDPHVPIEVMTECRMKLSSAQDVVRRALEQGISVGWFTGDDWYIPRWDPAVRRESAITGATPTVVPDLAHFTQAPHKLQCIIGEPALLPALSLLARTLPLDCVGHFSHASYLEITHLGVDKAAAMLALGQRLGIAPAAMVAIGDQENDMTMLQVAALGIAMGNAPPAVRAAADWVTDTNNRDGVAAAIERLQVTGWI